MYLTEMLDSNRKSINIAISICLIYLLATVCMKKCNREYDYIGNVLEYDYSISGLNQMDTGHLELSVYHWNNFHHAATTVFWKGSNFPSQYWP